MNSKDYKKIGLILLTVIVVIIVAGLRIYLGVLRINRNNAYYQASETPTGKFSQKPTEKPDGSVCAGMVNQTFSEEQCLVSRDGPLANFEQTISAKGNSDVKINYAVHYSYIDALSRERVTVYPIFNEIDYQQNNEALAFTLKSVCLDADISLWGTKEDPIGCLIVDHIILGLGMKVVTRFYQKLNESDISWSEDKIEMISYNLNDSSSKLGATIAIQLKLVHPSRWNWNEINQRVRIDVRCFQKFFVSPEVYIISNPAKIMWKLSLHSADKQRLLIDPTHQIGSFWLFDHRAW